MKSIAITIALTLLTTGCAGSKQLGGAQDVVIASSAELPVPTRSDLSVSGRPYVLGSLDRLHIDVFGVDNLTREIQIDAAGKIAFPLVGTLEASGKTPQELASDIANRLQGDYVRNPHVTVNILESVNNLMTVDGQVKEPGQYPVSGRMTLMRAVASAGGTTEYAKLKDVVLFREVGGKTYVGLYNLEGIRRGNYGDPDVYANDIIIIGDSSSRRLFDDILDTVPLISTPLVLLLRN